MSAEAVERHYIPLLGKTVSIVRLEAHEAAVSALAADVARLRAELQEARELLTDWAIAVDIQRMSGEPNIRNGVELRMHEFTAALAARGPHEQG